MSAQPPADLTQLINRMFRGDREAGDAALAALYPSLRRVASAKLRRERPGHLFETHALINEALVRLFGTANVVVKDRKHFFWLVCLLMRRVLIDCGRKKVPEFDCLEEAMSMLETPDREQVLAIDRILEELRRLDGRAYRAFELKVTMGMTDLEVARETGFATGTVKRDTKRARVWLLNELTRRLGKD